MSTVQTQTTTRSEAFNELAAALAKAQGKIKVAPKDNVAKVDSRTGTSFSYRYSTLADVWEACRAPLSENGLAVIQTVATEGAKVTVTTLIAHSSGQWISDDLSLIAMDPSPQKIGSCITYARRYALGSMVGVVSEEDDDGAEAQGRPTTISRRGQPSDNGNGSARPAPPAASDQSPALAEEFKQAMGAAKDGKALHAIGVKVADAGRAGKLVPTDREALTKVYAARAQELGAGAA